MSTRNIVDELSLALALREDADERVEEAAEEMLNELWGGEKKRLMVTGIDSFKEQFKGREEQYDILEKSGQNSIKL